MVQELLSASLAVSTRNSYLRVWKLYQEFCCRTLHVSEAYPPVPIANLILFLTDRFEQGNAASTIATYNSAIGYVHKLLNLPDPSTSFIVKQILKGSSKLRPSKECRLPITKSLLHRMILELLKEQPSFYQTLFIAMFLLAFYGFLRLSEFTYSSDTNHCLTIDDIEFRPIGQTQNQLVIHFKSFKHSVPSSVSHLTINNQQSIQFCPVYWMQRFISVRGTTKGSLFCHPDLNPITRKQFGDKLKDVLNCLGLNRNSYTTHSFRYGASTMAMSMGLSDAQIRSLGRWRSSAFLKYIRPG